jgi:YVTN family beta-propeller protein
MTRSPAVPSSAVLLLFVVGVSVAGCSFGQNGVDPPTDRIFLPAGIVVDPDYPILYVVNSNSDLRFNAGTVVAVDLAKAASTRDQITRNLMQVDTCSKTRFSRTEAVPGTFCCRDLVDSNIINCNEPQYIHAPATVSIGSFGGAVQFYKPARRLFFAVRAEPSITFADVTVTPSLTPSSDGSAWNVSLRCTGLRSDTSAQPVNAYCDDNWRVRRPAGASPGAQELPEEPHVLALDVDRGILLVGHLTVAANAQLQGGGVSALDLCDPTSQNSVRFAGLAQTVFLPTTASQAVAELSANTAPPSVDPANPSPLVPPLVYATARNSAQITGMVLRSPSNLACDARLPTDPSPDLTLVPGENFLSPAFLPYGSDVRGILFSDDGTQAFVLHRNDSDTIANPPALVVLDRHLLTDGMPANSVIDIMEVCNGPTAMQMKDVGRGKRIFVTCYDDGQLYVIDPQALVVTSVIDVGAGPTSLVFSPQDPVAYVASFANSHLPVIDLKPGSPTENHVVQRIGLPHGYGE